MSRFILASLHEKYFHQMRSGSKTHEFRDSLVRMDPPTPYFTFWYLTAPKASIYGVSVCEGYDNIGIPLVETLKLENPISLTA